jgi:competence protein ComEC
MTENKRQKFFLCLIFFLIVGNFFVWRTIFFIDDNLKVVFFDVGQGDAIFIETPQGHQILIDGGPSGEKISRKLSQIMPPWDKEIDLLILTHQDFDHLNGALEAMKRYKINNVIWNGQTATSDTFRQWQEILAKSEAKVLIANDDQLVEAGRAVLKIIYPFKEENYSVKNQNDSSIVLRLSFGEIDFLLSGDAGQAVEKILLDRKGDFLSSEIFKAAHHGSKTSNSRDFLKAVEPRLIVVSVGKDNKYGHPHPEVLQRFVDFAIKVLRTDDLGDIKIKTNGKEFWY